MSSKELDEHDDIKKSLTQINYAVAEVSSMLTQTKDQLILITSRVDNVEDDFSGLSKKVSREITDSKVHYAVLKEQIDDLRKDLLSKQDFQVLLNKALIKAITVVGTLLVTLLFSFGSFVIDKALDSYNVEEVMQIAD